jgi:hypothetical protein
MTTDIVSQNSGPIKPQMVDGIELYATDSECGMSQAGLARFCGVDRKTVSELLENIAGGRTSSKYLEPFAGQDLYLGAEGDKNAKIIRSEVCSAICKYYALESKAKNETALFSLCKFSDLGINSWIREVTGHTQKPELTPLEKAQQMVIDLQAQLIIEKTENTTKAQIISEQGKGLEKILSGREEVEFLEELPQCHDDDGRPRLYTLREYLDEIVGITKVSRSLYFRFANLVSFTAKTHGLKNLEQRETRSGPVNAYPLVQFPMLQVAWEEALRKEKEARLARMKQ